MRKKIKRSSHFHKEKWSIYLAQYVVGCDVTLAKVNLCVIPHFYAHWANQQLLTLRSRKTVYPFIVAGVKLYQLVCRVTISWIAVVSGNVNFLYSPTNLPFFVDLLEQQNLKGMWSDLDVLWMLRATHFDRFNIFCRFWDLVVKAICFF